MSLKETYQVCDLCGSTNIDKDSSAMGFHICNSCGSGASISWKERRPAKREDRTHHSKFKCTNKTPHIDLKIDIRTVYVALACYAILIFVGIKLIAAL